MGYFSSCPLHFFESLYLKIYLIQFGSSVHHVQVQTYCTQAGQVSYVASVHHMLIKVNRNIIQSRNKIIQYKINIKLDMCWWNSALLTVHNRCHNKTKLLNLVCFNTRQTGKCLSNVVKCWWIQWPHPEHSVNSINLINPLINDRKLRVWMWTSVNWADWLRLCSTQKHLHTYTKPESHEVLIQVLSHTNAFCQDCDVWCLIVEFMYVHFICRFHRQTLSIISGWKVNMQLVCVNEGWIERGHSTYTHKHTQLHSCHFFAAIRCPAISAASCGGQQINWR